MKWSSNEKDKTFSINLSEFHKELPNGEIILEYKLQPNTYPDGLDITYWTYPCRNGHIAYIINDTL